MSDTPKVTVIPIGDIKPDQKNTNKGNKRGRTMLEKSIRELGAGRSIVVDQNQVALGGNKTLDAAKSQGYKKVIVVETQGDELVAVKRTDLNANDKRAKRLAIADNRTNEVDLTWDVESLKDSELDLTEFWNPDELAELLADPTSDKRMDTIDTMPPPKKIWILIGIPFNRFDQVQEHVAALESEAEISVQSARNE